MINNITDECKLLVSVEFYQMLFDDHVINISQLKKFLQEIVTDYNNGLHDKANRHMKALYEKEMTIDAAIYMNSYFKKWNSKSTASKNTRSHITTSKLSNNAIKHQKKRLEHQWEIDDQNYEITRDYNNYIDTNYYDNNY